MLKKFATLVGVVEPMKYPHACAHREVATIVARNSVARVGSSGLSVSQYDSTTYDTQEIIWKQKNNDRKKLKSFVLSF